MSRGGRVFGGVLAPVGLALALAGCGGKDPADASKPTNPTATPTPKLAPFGPWHEGRSMFVADTVDSGPATVTFPAVTGVSIVSTSQRFVAIRPKGLPDRLFDVANSPGELLAAPVFDRHGRGVLVVQKPAESAVDSNGRTVDEPSDDSMALSWFTVDRYGRLGDEHELAKHALSPAVGADRDGNAVVAWLDASHRGYDSGYPQLPLRAAVQAHSEPFGKPVTLTQQASGGYTEGTAPLAEQVTAAVGAGGRIVVAAQAAPPGTKRQSVVAWTGTVDDGFVPAPVTVGRNLFATALTSAVSTTGQVFVAWGDQSSGEDPDSPWIVRAASVAPGASQSGPVQVLDRGIADYPVALPVLEPDAQGGAVLAWSGVEYVHKRDPAGIPVFVSSATSAGTFGPRQRLARFGAVTGLAISPAGDAIVTWRGLNSDPNGGTFGVSTTGFFASVRAAGSAAFSQAERVPIAFPADGPPPSFAQSGRPAVAYVVPTTSGTRGETIHVLVRDKP